ncbi:MAG: hypothetical protein ABIJ15_06125 [bacterium]
MRYQTARGFAGGDSRVRGLALGSLRARAKLLAHTAPPAKTRSLFLVPSAPSAFRPPWRGTIRRLAVVRLRRIQPAKTRSLKIVFNGGIK